MASPLSVEQLAGTPVAHQLVEIVERKGTGHPDTICDAAMEAVSVRLSQEYLRRFGRVLHHNNDKALLAGGQSAPAFGGGAILEPMRFILGDRAVRIHDGEEIQVGTIAKDAVRQWMKSNLRFVDADRHMVLQDEIKPGSPELVGNFQPGGPGANDTSVGVGHAPLTPTEQLTLDLERHINSKRFQAAFPFAGEDVKVMSVRTGSHLDLTVAMACVDQFIGSEREYFDGKAAVQSALRSFIRDRNGPWKDVRLDLNALDHKGRGADGLYLTVLGTSAEGGDSGQVGRGNRASGLITFNRAMSLEAVAGKNPVSHTGKIYNLLAKRMAERICQAEPGVHEVTVRIVSRIGSPLSEPSACSAHLVLAPGTSLGAVRRGVEEAMAAELAGVADFVKDLARGKYPVC